MAKFRYCWKEPLILVTDVSWEPQGPSTEAPQTTVAIAGGQDRQLLALTRLRLVTTPQSTDRSQKRHKETPAQPFLGWLLTEPSLLSPTRLHRATVNSDS
jgi:hypothetical protein